MDTNERGLTDLEVIQSRKTYGPNKFLIKKHSILLSTVKGVVINPIFLLLTCCGIIYFLMGQNQEGLFIIVAIFFISSISIYQENRSKNAIHLMSKLTAPLTLVKRNNFWITKPIEDLVVGDWIIINEGELIPADGIVVKSNDLSISEAVLTGESMPIEKHQEYNNKVYRSTLVIRGRGLMKITHVGINTQLGKISKSVDTLKVEKTPFQISVSKFIRYILIIGVGIFLFLVVFNIIQSRNFLLSILQGLTLAMSILPEEIPVALATFEALGSFLLLKKHNIIIKQPRQVETLGLTNVICLDKTGTITQNKIQLDCIYDVISEREYAPFSLKKTKSEIIEYAMLSSEMNSRDPMEIEIFKLHETITTSIDRTKLKLIREYPIENSIPMMTHVFKTELNENIIAVKGAPEHLLEQSSLNADKKNSIKKILNSYTDKGRRVIGVGKLFQINGELPDSQIHFHFDFLGLLVYKDPLKQDIKETIALFKKAGIQVKMITGDHALTGKSIAKEIGLNYTDSVLLGLEVINMNMDELREKVDKIDVYARMFPDAKLKVIEALKLNGEIVAMTGDGVNDAPALKASHIGISMGKSGTEIARESSSIVIRDDNLSHLVSAVAVGRKIYLNLKKAFRYIISIHIPIFLIVIIPILFNWKILNIFSPIHVIFLELIMGPTCSIIFEKEPIEEGVMSRKPISVFQSFISKREFIVSFFQGIIIALGCLGLGYYGIYNHKSDTLVRTLIFITLLFSNIFLTLVNRSFDKNLLITLRYRNNLIWAIIFICIFFIMLLVYNGLFNSIFGLQHLNLIQMLTCMIVGLFCTIWIEPFKKIINQKMVV